MGPIDWWVRVHRPTGQPKSQTENLVLESEKRAIRVSAVQPVETRGELRRRYVAGAYPAESTDIGGVTVKQSSARGVLVLSMLAVLLISACSGAASPVPGSKGPGSQAPASQAAGSQPSEKIIYFASGATPGSPEDYLIPVFTTARATLKAQGYDLQYSSLSNDEVVEAALDRGRVDVALLSMVGLQRAVKAGLHMKWLVTNETQNTFVLVVHKDVTDLTQLKGKKIGAQDATSLSTAALPGILGPAGLAPADYTVAYLAGSGNRSAALTAGSMDASMMLYTIATQLITKSNGEFKIWGGGAAAAQPAMWEGLVASDAFRANKPAATAFVKAVLDAYKQFYAGDAAKIAKDAIALNYNELQGLDEASTTADLKLYQSIKLFPVDGGVGEDLFTSMITTLVAVDQLKQADTVPYADAVDPSFVAAAK